MVMSNFIDESERHAEIFFAFTVRQKFILRMLKIFNNQHLNEPLKRFYLLCFISKEELYWLERTGRITRSGN